MKTLSKLQTSPLSEGLSIFATIIVVIITCIIVYVASTILYDMGDLPYVAPDANHIKPVGIVWIVALAGFCSIFLIKMENRSISRTCRISAFLLISIFTLAVTNAQMFYSYDTNDKCWVHKNVYGATQKMYANYDARAFGNVLLMKNNEKQRKAYDAMYEMDGDFYYDYPHLYLPDGSKTTLPWVYIVQVDPMDIYGKVNFAIFRNDTTSENMGVVDGNLNVIVSPDTCKGVWSIPGEYFLVRNKDNKKGLVNIHGDVILPFIYDGLNYLCIGIASPFEVRFFEGGFLEAKKDGETLFVDTLGNTLSIEEYRSMHPDDYNEWVMWDDPYITAGTDYESFSDEREIHADTETMNETEYNN